MKRFLQKTMLNAKVNNWDIELSDFNIKFKFIKGVKNTLADTLFRLINLEFPEPNTPQREGHEPRPPEKGYEYGYAVLEPLPDMHVDSSNCDQVLPIDISSVNDTMIILYRRKIIKMQKFIYHSAKRR